MKKSPRIFRRTIRVVLILFIALACFLVWVFNSSWLAENIVNSVIARVNLLDSASLEISGFKGSLKSGIKVEQIRFRQARPPVQILAEGLSLDVDFMGAGKGATSFSGRLNNLEIYGLTAAPIASSTIPNYRGLSAFAGIGSGFRVDSFTLATASFIPWPDMPLKINLSQLCIESADAGGSQALSMLLSGTFRDRRIVKGEVSGRVTGNATRFEGGLDVNFAGQKLLSEINITSEKRQIKAGGFISSASLDITGLSRWLIPVWQDTFPFGFDGNISGSGSWHYSRDMGFLGNLSGDFSKVRMVALGLFINIFELNCSWKLFDGAITLADTGSNFLGFPATIRGKIDSVLEPSRKWAIDFDCEAVNFAELVENLPWGVKYTMGLPPLAGMATFSLKLRGIRPEISSSLLTEKLDVGIASERRLISGVIDYSLGAVGPGKFVISMKTTAEHVPPPLWRRYKGVNSTLAREMAVNSSPPYLLDYTFSGIDSGDLTLSGLFYCNGKQAGSVRGRWYEGMGSSMALINNANSPLSFVVNDVPLLEFILQK